MAKYIIRDVEYEIDVSIEVDPRKKFDISGDTFAELKQNGADLQQQIADEFDVNIDRVTIKRGNLKRNRFVVF